MDKLEYPCRGTTICSIRTNSKDLECKQAINRGQHFSELHILPVKILHTLNMLFTYIHKKFWMCCLFIYTNIYGTRSVHYILLLYKYSSQIILTKLSYLLISQKYQFTSCLCSFLVYYVEKPFSLFSYFPSILFINNICAPIYVKHVYNYCKINI